MSSAEAMIAHLKLMIAKYKRDKFGQSSERARHLDQLEFQLEELEATATEDALAAEAAAKTASIAVKGFERKKPMRAPLPSHLPRERVVVPAPCSCPSCGGKLAKLGEDITETLEVIPRQWKVIQTVREKFSCRACEIHHPTAGTVPSDRARAGRCRSACDDSVREVWAASAAQPPGRAFGGPAPPAAAFYYSRDRAGEHPQAHLATYTGLFQADAYSGYGKLYEPGRTPGPIFEAACWVHARRPFFVMADLAENARRKAQGKKPAAISPLALQAVRRIDALFDIERTINGQSAERRKAVRQELSAPLVADLEAWMREQRAKLSRGNDVAKAFDYMLKRWTVFTRFLDDGRICLSNNAAERGVRGIALGRKSWLFCGSDRGGQRAAVMYSLIVTAKMNDVDPHAWLADVLARIAEHPVQKLDELLPWNWCPLNAQARQAA